MCQVTREREKGNLIIGVLQVEERKKKEREKRSLIIGVLQVRERKGKKNGSGWQQTKKGNSLLCWKESKNIDDDDDDDDGQHERRSFSGSGCRVTAHTQKYTKNLYF